MARDLDGLEPLVEDGMLVGYLVMKEQGPTQIAEDLNDPRTQEQFGYCMLENVLWTDIVYNNVDKFKNVIEGDGIAYDVENKDFYTGNIKPGDKLLLNNSKQLELIKRKNVLVRILQKEQRLESNSDQLEKVNTEVKFRRNLKKKGIYIDDPRGVHIAEDLHVIRDFGPIKAHLRTSIKEDLDSIKILKDKLKELGGAEETP